MTVTWKKEFGELEGKWNSKTKIETGRWMKKIWASLLTLLRKKNGDLKSKPFIFIWKEAG